MLAFICCAGGATSSLFCSHIAQAADPEEIHFDDLKTLLDHYDDLSRRYPILIGYGSEQLVDWRRVNTMFRPYVDHVFVCPQVRYRTPVLRQTLAPVGIPVDDLDMRMFGTMNGELALRTIIHDLHPRSAAAKQTMTPHGLEQ
ncbi:PTS sugar transporter subunit IIB [Lapidilactobacillus luobeiensis]|uniref:PTS sugar transporter subunit IIB n=1 Tax=Lapidilactobacillus luobeiensis TaxID=2950371 RepID=UPI0021C4C664|nr:hypothetical protein [Lapidilactobacillus luobeiensis]